MKAKHSALDYCYHGTYDQGVFASAYTDAFAKVPKFNKPSVPDLLFLLGKVGADSRITDIRWAAYMLATTFIESSHTTRVTKVTVDKKGRAKSHSLKVWRNFTPTEEAGHGKGRPYYLPVKVTRLASGDAQICEYDGERWTVSAQTGHMRAAEKHQSRGVAATTKASEIYDADEGDSQLYYGRGYVQLTWWNNYANAGIALSRGLELLFDPSLVNDPDLAYAILATGMCTGGIYANGRTFS